ncbi:hypothetical protein V7S43_016424 [Phytophthora oleae]|uniref:Uncharacterized protein n=1 Tax=Phytophthora oleae TaxID=2107226 RepID=A0ABD3EZQ1_9STRA
MAKKSERGGCTYSSKCKKALDIKDDGTAHSMCKKHWNYKVAKLRERRSKRIPRTFAPFQCQYPGGCKKERSIKLNGDRHWLCELHWERQNALARERYKRRSIKYDDSNQTHSDTRQ